MSIPGELNPSKRYLMGPGPSDAHPRVLKAMATPLIGHLDPQFVAIMDDVKVMLQDCLRTRNAMTFAVSAPGSAGSTRAPLCRRCRCCRSNAMSTCSRLE